MFTGASVVGSVDGTLSTEATGVVEFYSTTGHSFTTASSVTGTGMFRARNASVTVNGAYSMGTTDITADFVGGMLSFSSPATVSTTNLTIRDGGERGGSGVLEVSGTFDFQSGDLDGSGTTRVMQGGTLQFSSNLIRTLTNGHTLQNSGTVIALNGGLRPRGGSTIENQVGGVFDIRGDAFTLSWENTGNSIINAGTFRKSVGTGTNQIPNTVPFTNAAGGVIDIQTGTLSIGDLTHQAGAVIQGAGTLELATVTAFEGVSGQ